MPYRIDGLRAMSMQAAGQLAANGHWSRCCHGVVNWFGVVEGRRSAIDNNLSTQRLVEKVDAVLYLNSR